MAFHRKYYSREQLEDRAVQMALAWWPIEDIIALKQLHIAEEYEHKRFIARMLEWEREQALLRALERRYNADQPRVPAGSPDGGQWVGNNGSHASDGLHDRTRIHGASHPASPPQASPVQSLTPSGITSTQTNALGQVVAQDYVALDGSSVHAELNPDGSRSFDSRYTVTTPGGQTFVFTNKGDRQTIADAATGQVLADTARVGDRIVSIGSSAQTAGVLSDGMALMPRLGPYGVVPLAGLAAGAAVFNYDLGITQTNNPAIFLRARQFGDETEFSLERVSELTQKQTELMCPKYPLVQAATDDAFQRAQAEHADAGPQVFGTKAHVYLRDNIKDLNFPDLKAELTLDPNGTVKKPSYATLGFPRLDILELTPDRTICVYDLKTGVADLSPARMKQLADVAHQNFRDFDKIIVIGLRPTSWSVPRR